MTKGFTYKDPSKMNAKMIDKLQIPQDTEAIPQRKHQCTQETWGRVSAEHGVRAGPRQADGHRAGLQHSLLWPSWGNFGETT